MSIVYFLRTGSGFWGIIKSEMYYLETFRDEYSLRTAIEKYIHFYNYHRFQERFANQTPMEVRIAALNSDEPAHYPIPENKRIQKYKANLLHKKSHRYLLGNGEINEPFFVYFPGLP